MNTIVTQREILYAIYVRDFAPEFWPAVAFRRAEHFKDERRKIIKCPYCGKQLTAVGESTRLELFRYPRRMQVNCHEYRKCNACNETVGIIFVRN